MPNTVSRDAVHPSPNTGLSALGKEGGALCLRQRKFTFNKNKHPLRDKTLSELPPVAGHRFLLESPFLPPAAFTRDRQDRYLGV